MNSAFVGLGVMGMGMARNIMKEGHKLTVFNRTRAKADELAAEGALAADTPAEAAAEADVIVVCVSDSADVVEVVLGEDGIIHRAKPGSVVVDCSTISPEVTKDVGKALADKGVGMIDAPVSGGSEGAINGTLTIMIGGQAEHLDQARPILEAMGQTITHVGDLGAGQLTKCINQIICGINFLSVAEGMALGMKAGLDMDKVLAAIRGGAAGSWVLTNRAENMLKNQYPLGFKVGLHRKDLGYVLEVGRKVGASLPATALVAQLEDGLIGQGFGDEDASSVARAIRKLSGID
jgi:3-hydroxyisobutyrate dehydrogenase